MIQLARAFAQSGIEFDATIVFIAFAGEEEGLVGAKLHAQRAKAEGWRIDAVLNNDIVGNSRGGTGASDGESVRVFSEGPGDSMSRQIARYVRRVAMRYQPGGEAQKHAEGIPPNSSLGASSCLQSQRHGNTKTHGDVFRETLPRFQLRASSCLCVSVVTMPGGRL